MSGRRSNRQRIVLSESLLVPEQLQLDVNDRATLFKRAVNASLKNAALNPDVSVKVAFVNPSVDSEDTDGRKREFSADAQPGVEFTPEGWRYKKGKTFEDGDILRLFPTFTSRHSISTEPNFGWMKGDPFETKPFSETLSAINRKPQIKLTKYKVDPRTDDIDPTSATVIDSFSIPSGLSLEQRRRIQQPKLKQTPETKNLGRSLSSRVPGGTLLSRAAAAIGVILDERNKFRCPPMTPAANQFTDRFGSTCFGFSPSRFNRYAQRAARELMPDERSGFRRSVRSWFSFLNTGEAKWLEEPGEWGRTIEFDATTGERRETPNWRTADVPGERKWLKGAMVRAQDEIALVKARSAELGASLGVDQSDAARATNEDLHQIFDKLRETGQWDVQLLGPNNGQRLTPQQVEQMIAQRLSREMGWSSLSREEQALLIKQDVARYYESERGFLEATLNEFVTKPQSAKQVKAIIYDNTTPNEAVTDTYQDGKTKKFHQVIKVNLERIMTNQERMLPNLSASERLLIATVGPKTDAEAAAGAADFLMNANYAARVHAGMVDGAYSFASHIGAHEFGHAYQIGAILREINHQLMTKGKIEIPKFDRNGRYVGKTVTDIRQLTNDDLWLIVKGSVKDVNIAATNEVLRSTKVVEFLAGSYPQQFSDEPGVKILELSAELYALRERGFFAGETLDQVNAALSWIDNGIFADAADKARIDAETEAARRAADEFKPDDGSIDMTPPTIESLRADFDEEKKEMVTEHRKILTEQKERLPAMDEAAMRDMAATIDFEIAQLEDQILALNKTIDGFPENYEETVSTLQIKQSRERLLIDREFRLNALEQTYKGWRTKYTTGGAKTRDRFYMNIDEDQKRLGLKRRKRKKRSSDSDYADSDSGDTEGSTESTVDFELEAARVQHKVADYTPERIEKLLARRLRERAAIAEKDSDEYLKINNEIDTLIDSYVSKVKEGGDRRSKAKIRKDLEEKLEAANKPKPKKTKTFKSKAERATFASEARSKASRKRTKDQKNAVDQLGNFDDARILEVIDPEKMISAGTAIGTAHSRAKNGTMDGANPKSIHEASLEDQVKNILIPAMEAIDKSAAETPFTVEAVMEFDSSSVSGRVVGREIERRGFTTGTLMVREKGEIDKPATSKADKNSGKTTRRVVISVKEGDRGIFSRKAKNETSPTFVMPPGRLRVTGRDKDGTIYAEFVHQQDVTEVVGGLVSELGDAEPRKNDNMIWRQGKHKSVKNVYDNYMNSRRASGDPVEGPMSRDEDEIKQTGRNVTAEVTEAGGSFGAAPDDDDGEEPETPVPVAPEPPVSTTTAPETAGSTTPTTPAAPVSAEQVRTEQEQAAEERAQELARVTGDVTDKITTQFGNPPSLRNATLEEVKQIDARFEKLMDAFREVARLMQVVDGAPRFESLVGNDRFNAVAAIQTYLGLYDAFVSMPGMEGYVPDPETLIGNAYVARFIPGFMKSLEHELGIETKQMPSFFERKPVGRINDNQTPISRKNSKLKTRSQRKRERNEQTAKTLTELKKILGGGSSRDLPGVTRADIDRRLVRMISEEPVEVLIARLEKAAMRMHFGFDRRVRLRTNQQELEQIAENGGIRYSHGSSEPVASRRLERLSRMNPETRDTRDMSFFARANAKRAESALETSELARALRIAESLVEKNTIIADMSNEELSDRFNGQVRRTSFSQKDGVSDSFQTSNREMALVLMLLGYKVLFTGEISKTEREAELADMVEQIEDGAAREIKGQSPQWNSFIDGKLKIDDSGIVDRTDRFKEIQLRNEFSQGYTVDPCMFQYSQEAVNPVCLEGVDMPKHATPQLIGHPINERSMAARMLKQGLIDGQWISVFKKKLNDLKSEGLNEPGSTSVIDKAISDSMQQKMIRLRENDNRYMAYAARHLSKSMPNQGELNIMSEQLREKVLRLTDRLNRLTESEDLEQDEIDDVTQQLFDARNDYSIAEQAKAGPLSEDERDWFYKNTLWSDVEVDLQEEFAKFVKLVNDPGLQPTDVRSVEPLMFDAYDLVANQQSIRTSSVKDIARNIVRDVTVALDEMQDLGLYPRTEEFDSYLQENMKTVRNSYPITVADGKTIIDGHHNWAATLLANKLLGKKLSIPVYGYAIDSDPITVSALARIFQKNVGIAQAKEEGIKQHWSENMIVPININDVNSWMRDLANRAEMMIPEVMNSDDFMTIAGLPLSIDGRNGHGNAANRLNQVKKYLAQRSDYSNTSRQFESGLSNVSTKKNPLRRDARDMATILRASEKSVTAAIKKTNLDQKTSESLKYAIFFVSSYEQGGSGALGRIAMDIADRSGAEIAQVMLEELTKANKLSSKRRQEILSNLSVRGFSINEVKLRRIKNAFADGMAALRASVKTEKEIDKTLPVEYMFMPRHIVGKNTSLNISAKQESMSPDEEGRTGKSVGKIVDVLARNNFERIGIPKHLPDDRLPITGYVVHKSHVNKRMDDTAMSGSGAVSPIAVFETKDKDNAGDGLTAFGDIEIVLKRGVSERVSYSRGSSMANGTMPVLLNSSNRDDIADAYYGSTGKNSKMANLEAILGLLLAEATNNYSLVNSIFAPGDESDGKRVFEALVLGGVDKDEIKQINYPYSRVADMAKSEDITKVIPETEITQRLTALGMTPENIEYINSLPSSKTQTRATDEIRAYLAAKKIVKKLNEIGFDNVKIAHPDGFDVMDPRSYSRGARPSDDVIKVLKEKAIIEVSEIAKNIIGVRNTTASPQLTMAGGA